MLRIAVPFDFLGRELAAPSGGHARPCIVSRLPTWWTQFSWLARRVFFSPLCVLYYIRDYPLSASCDTRRVQNWKLNHTPNFSCILYNASTGHDGCMPDNVKLLLDTSIRLCRFAPVEVRMVYMCADCQCFPFFFLIRSSCAYTKTVQFGIRKAVPINASIITGAVIQTRKGAALQLEERNRCRAGAVDASPWRKQKKMRKLKLFSCYSFGEKQMCRPVSLNYYSVLTLSNTGNSAEVQRDGAEVSLLKRSFWKWSAPCPHLFLLCSQHYEADVISYRQHSICTN